MRCLRMAAVCWLVLMLCSCEEPHLYTDGGPSHFAITGVSFSDPQPAPCESVTATISFEGVTGPFVFTVNFAQGVTPSVATVTAPNGATSATLTFAFDDFTRVDYPAGRDCTITVTGVDANGSPAGPITGMIHVDGTE